MNYQQQLRAWVEHEFELLDPDDEFLCDPIGSEHGRPYLFLQNILVDKLVDKYEQISDANHYDDVRSIILELWLETASPERLRQEAAFVRRYLKHANKQQAIVIKQHATMLERLAHKREGGS